MEKDYIEYNVEDRAKRSRNLPVVFYSKILFDEEKTSETGKISFKRKPFIDIYTGDDDNIKTYPVDEELEKRYDEQWKSFKNFIAPLITYNNEVIDLQIIFSDYPEVYKKYKENIKNIVGYDGTLIEEICIYPHTKAEELKYYGYFFIEQILELKEENEIISKEMIEIAKKWKEKQDENEILKKQVLELSDLVTRLTTRLKNNG